MGAPASLRPHPRHVRRRPIVLILAAAAALASPTRSSPPIIIGAATGILAHIAADACTVSGITAWPSDDGPAGSGTSGCYPARSGTT
jgi:hypothetical protein